MNKCLLFLLIPAFLISCASGPEQPLMPKNLKRGNIQFFETYQTNEMLDSWRAACNWSKEQDSLSNTSSQQLSERTLENLVQLGESNAFGYVREADVPAVKLRLSDKAFKEKLPENLEFMWSYGLESAPNNQKMFALYAVRVPDSGEAPINGKDIQLARHSLSAQTGQPVINISMTKEGANKWRQMTRKNINRYIAVTMDQKVLSCPLVNMEISGGETEISGNFSVKEAEKLASQINGEK